MKTLISGFLFACTIVFQPAALIAQVSTENRIEFDLKEENSNYQVMPFGEKGIIVFSQNTKNETAQIERYDTNLKAVDKETITFPKGYYLNSHVETEDALNILLTDRKSHYIFYRVNPENLKMEKVSGILPKKSYITKMDVSGDFAFISGKAKKNALLIKISIKSGKGTIVPLDVMGYSPSDFSVENIQVLEDTKETMIGIYAWTKQQNDYVILKFDDKGNKKDEIVLSKATDKKIISATASSLGNDEYIFTGTYSSKARGSSEGMYFSKTSGGKVEFIKFYNFLDFKEFLSYLPDKKKEKIERKEERKERDGDEYAINYLIKIHPIIKMDDNFLLIGEAYFPTYRQESYTTYVNGKATTSYRMVFDGYQYTHATVASFNGEGEKLWDKTFEMWPSYKPFTPREFISVSNDDEVVNLLFTTRATIRSVSFGFGGEVARDEATETMETGDEADKIKAEASNLQFWYESYFLAFGAQVIKNSEESFGNKKRSVYFISKINYEL